MAERKAPTIESKGVAVSKSAGMSKQVDAVQTAQAPVKSTDAAAKTTLAGSKLAASLVPSKGVSARSEAQKTAMAPSQTAPEEEEDEEVEEESRVTTDDGVTKTDSLAMPSTYQPPKLVIGDLPVSLAGATMAEKLAASKALKISQWMGKTGQVGKLGKVSGARKKKKGKKGKRKGKGKRKKSIPMLYMSMDLGERESLLDTDKGRDKRKPGRKRIQAIHIAVGVGVLVIVVVALIVTIVLLTRQ